MHQADSTFNVFQSSLCFNFVVIRTVNDTLQKYIVQRETQGHFRNCWNSVLISIQHQVSNSNLNLENQTLRYNPIQKHILSDTCWGIIVERTKELSLQWRHRMLHEAAPLGMPQIHCILIFSAIWPASTQTPFNCCRLFSHLPHYIICGPRTQFKLLRNSGTLLKFSEWSHCSLLFVFISFHYTWLHLKIFACFCWFPPLGCKH